MSAPDLPDETLFEAALNCRTPAERQAYLDLACGGQPELRRQLEVLLEAHGESGLFLEEPAASGPSTVRLDGVAEEASGTVIGRYKLLQKIGEGGMGVVYMAEQTQPVVRKVALKIIKLGMDTRQVVARFEAERQALALMDHPNIAKVLDGGATETGRPYFVMELVHGVPITDYCDRNRLPPRERLELFITVCQAIQHAHQKGIVHRDIKPSNVMVTLHDGVPVPRVIDFGVAKATNQRLTEKTVFTHYATMIGTPAYMSPEQAEMSGLDIDTRSDIYSLGVLLYELLTGTTPFDPTELLSLGYGEMQRIIAQEEPPRPSTRMSTMQRAQQTVVAKNRSIDPGALSRALKGDLDWIVMKCLEKDRTRRYETSNGLAADVQRHLNNELITARPPTTGYLLKKLIRRNRVAFLSAAVVTSALLLAVVALTWTTVRVTRERNQRDLALRERGAAMQLATQRSEEAQEQLFLALCDEAKAHRYSRRVGQRLHSLAALTEAARIRRVENLRDDAIAAMALPDLRGGPVSDLWVPENRIVAFDDLYQRYAHFEPDGSIRVCSTSDGREIQRIASSSSIHVLKLSPNGERVAKLESRNRLRVWRVADGQPALREVPVECSIPAFSHDSRQLAVGQSKLIRRFDLVTGHEILSWPVPSEAARLAFDNTGHRLAVGYAHAAATSVYDATDGSLVADLPVGRVSDQVVAWHPDGEHLAISGSDPCIQVWNVDQRRLIARLTGHVQQVTDLSFHPQEGYLASHGWDGVLRLWEPWSGRELLRTTSRAQIRFSRDGRWLGIGWMGDCRYQLLEVAPSPEYRSLSPGLGLNQVGVYEGDISPDSRWLALGTQQGVHVWSLSSGRLMARLPTGPCSSALFQPDGSALITCGYLEVQRWSIDGTDRDELQFGSPETIPLPFAQPTRISLTPDGQILGVVSESAGKACVLPRTSEGQPLSVVKHGVAGFLALSRDARRLATAGWHSSKVRLWDTQTGKALREWNVSKESRVFFTPDDRELVIARGEGFDFWNVETFEQSRSLPREGSLYGDYVAFSPDGNLMALPTAPGIVEIKDVTTARTVARLEDPFGDRSSWMAFTPGNRKLVVIAGWVPAIHIWDLTAIRERLEAMGLPADWPGSGPVGQSEPHDRTPGTPRMRTAAETTDRR